MIRLVNVDISETIIARLRADLAASQAHARRLAKEVGEATERRDWLWQMFKNVTGEYSGLRASIGQPVHEAGASTHASAVLHGQWLVLCAKDRAKAQRAQAFVSRLERDGVVIPSTAPVRVLDGDDDSERDEPDGDEWIEVRAMDVAIGQVARQYTFAIDYRRIDAPDEHAGYYVFRCVGFEPTDLVLGTLATMYVRTNDGIGIDRTAAGCTTACTDRTVVKPPWTSCTEGACMISHSVQIGDVLHHRGPCKVLVPWTGDIKADHGTPDQTDGYHGGDTELAAGGVLDDPWMAGEEWIDHSDVTVAMGDAWPLWERRYYKGSHSIDHWVKLCGRLPVGTYRPLRFPHQNVKTGAISGRYMTEDHFVRCEWQWREPAWFTAWRDDAEVKLNVMRAMGDKVFDRIEWRPVGWPDVEISADELEANIDRGLRMSLDAGAKAVAAYDAAIAKYSPDMRDLAGRIADLEARVASVSTLLPLMEKFWERLNKLEGAEPDEAPSPRLDGLVPVRADETHPGQWMMLDDSESRWKRYAPEPGEATDLPADHIALEAGLGRWGGRYIESAAIVYVEPE